MTPARREQINRLAEIVRESCKLATPLNVDDLVERLDGTMVTTDTTEFEAMVEKDGEAFKITLSNEASENRKKFSVAHEIGHLFLHMGYLIDEAKWKSNEGRIRDSVYYRFGKDPQEYEANEFAAALLMPGDEFIRVAMQNLDEGKFNIHPIARHFDVSEEAALNRGRWLGVFNWNRD